MTKSHVGIGVSVCPICGKEHDEVVLIHKFLKPELAPRSCTGFDLCPEHEKMTTEYLAFVEAQLPVSGATLKLETAQRTGRFAHVRRAAADEMLRTKFPADLPMVFVEPGFVAMLEEMSKC